MANEDLAFAVELTNTVGWGMSEGDFRFTMELEPDGCFMLLHNSTKAGLATNVIYGKVSWFGNLIVKGDCRGRGGGSLLVRYSLNYLAKKRVTSVGLYSYKEKIPFYEKLGFKRDMEFIVLEGKGHSSPADASVKQCGTDNLKQIVSFDTKCFGASRKKMLESIISDKDNLCFLYAEDGRVVGYTVAKVFDEKAEHGPLVCEESREDVAIRLLNSVLRRLKDVDVSTCVPESEPAIIDALTDAGFRESFRVARMFLGKPHSTRCILVAESLERG